MLLQLWLTGTLLLAVNIQPARSFGTVYIRADGSIEPMTAPIQHDGSIYTLTDNIYDVIVVEKSNIIIDGNGLLIQGSGIGYGLELNAVSNVTVKNANIEGFYCGVYLKSASQSLILANNITANTDFGIMGYSSSNNTMRENKIRNNFYGIWLSLDSSNNSIVRNNITANNWQSISLFTSHNNTITGNEIVNNQYGIWLGYSSNNIISGNNIIATSGYGIELEERASNNSIFENKIMDNYGGIKLNRYSNYNSIFGNNIASNSGYGFLLSMCSNNTIYHNNLVQNSQQVYIETSVYINFKDEGHPFEGNFWSNYTGVDLNRDGIGDTPHIIDANNTDNYPLMGLFSSFTTSQSYYVNVVSNSTIEDFEYFESNATIRMHVSNTTENQTYGFVRISIPLTLMSEPYNVTIEGANPIYWNYTLYDNGTHRWIYFVYEHSTLEIIILSEFPSLIIVLAFMITTLVATIAFRKRKPRD